MVEARVSPHLEFALELRVNIGPVLELGWGSFGLRRMVPITGGTFRGPGFPVASCLEEPTGSSLTATDSRWWMRAYVIETADAVRIEVSNPGIRHGAPGVLDRIAAGEPVSPSQYYFRTTPRFHPPDGKYDWLKRSIFPGDAERHAELVVVRVWKVA